MTRVLVVAYYFPPVGGGGVTRPLRAVRALAAAGHAPWVLTVDDAAWARDASRLADVPRRARVLRVPNPDWGRLAAQLPARRAAGRSGTGAPGRLRRWLVPDLHVGWSALAAGATGLLAAARAVDVVLTTAPPYSAFLAGAAAAALGVPWLADFRDGWTCCPTRSDLPPRRVAFERRLEDFVLRRADHVLFASEAVRARCVARVGDLAARSETLLTGFDPGEARGAAGAGEGGRRDALEIVHAGSVLGARRETCLDAFLAALAGLLRGEPGARGRLRVRFVGAEPAVRERIAAAGLDGAACWAPPVPRAVLPDVLRRADLCLILQPAGPRGGDPIPGKLFDAASARRPVLALAPAGAFPALVARLGLGVAVDPADRPAAERALREALRRVRAGATALPVEPAGFAALSGERFATRVVSLCEALGARGGLRCPSPSAS
jgi:glycosyltransferase involved in cell wall biosynthesis